MNKIRLIDLLNKIAKGEEVPKKIKYFDKLWSYIDNDYENCDMSMFLFGDYIDKNYYIIEVLNDEVEIIEENKKIEKLILISVDEYGNEINFTPTNDELQNKINELIDEVNKLKEEKCDILSEIK